MPMPVDLYFSENMEDLIKRSEFVVPQSTPYTKCLSLMEKLHKEAVKSRDRLDEENEFFHLHRYLTLSTYLSKSNKNKESKNNSVINETFLARKKKEYARASKNIGRYSELQTILKARYEARERQKSMSNVAITNANNFDNSGKLAKPAPSPLSVAVEKGFIECNQLYSFITNKTRKELLLIFDVRSAKDFKESHVDFDHILNIPEEIISSGMSAVSLGKKLDGADVNLWEKRTDADILVLMDWSTSMSSRQPSSKVMVLKNIILQWDPLKHYKSKPLILQGGYEELIERYPLITTNPKVEIPRSPSLALSDAPSVSDLEYPLEDLEPERPKTAPPVPKPDPPPQEARHSAPSSVDRSTKPTTVASNTQVTDENIDSIIDDLADSLSDDLGPLETPSEVDDTRKSHIVEPVPTNTAAYSDSSSDDEPPNSGGNKAAESRKPDPALVDDLRKLKPTYNNNDRPTASNIGEKGPSMDGDRPQKSRSATSNNENGFSRVPLKKDGSSAGILRRSSSSPNIKDMSDDESPTHHMPSFSRANKPSTPKVQHYLYSERTDSIHGTTSPGLTGLKNFANNCYMNSIVQCLNNTEPLVNELLRLQSASSVNVGSRLKGRIAQEVISAFRSMWSGEIKVYSIRELKSLMGDIKDIFKGSMHQDSNEFLIILLEHLHEDLNMPAEVENLIGAVEETGEKAWGEFRRKNCSIIQQLFYGQHRSTVTCSTCGHNSATFEQFFNLFVPIPPGRSDVTLNECIQLYMSGERINGWKCPNCKVERNATKKFDISRLPPVLIIALKRFTQEDGSWLHKKENLVSYPLDNLDMSRFTVPGSEQRNKVYNLYAMSTHSGTLQSGHYRAICKNPWVKKWFMFDDQSVDPLTESSVQSNPEVYILFYIAKQSS
uniref:Ubiquitin carboxyl-terminal hydrolase n=1 Tax=Lygus hesperus TaxID=30085 RepID=A0A146MBD9_LYGHE